MPSINTYFKFAPANPHTSSQPSGEGGGSGVGMYANLGWYQRTLQGSYDRLKRYNDYDQMDADIDIARALDIIAEEMTGNDPKTRLPLNIHIEAGYEENIPSSVYSTLQAALNTWCAIHKWHGGKLFNIARNMLKYGDCFFERPDDKNRPFLYIPTKNVRGAYVADDDNTDIRGWAVDSEYKRRGLATDIAHSSNTGTGHVIPLDNNKIIRFSLYDDMADIAPFGKSILHPIFRAFKHKELLEDAVIIYRITRAPEKRAFYVDVTGRPDHQVPGILTKFKNQIKQKKVPTAFNGKNQTDSIYNPQSMNEDFFFASHANGGGSKVETLPGGQSLGELTDLDHFYRKMWRGLRIPSSYMGNAVEDGSSSESEARVGVAYMQEIKFAQYTQRLQRYIDEVMDVEFKRWLYDSGITVDPTIYRILLSDPSDYHASRQQVMDADRLSNFSSLEGVDFLSKRFVLGRYLGLTKDEIAMNETMLREEKAMTDAHGDNRDLTRMYRPEEAESEGFDGGTGAGGGGGDFGGGDFDASDDINMDDEASASMGSKDDLAKATGQNSDNSSSATNNN